MFTEIKVKSVLPKLVSFFELSSGDFFVKDGVIFLKISGFHESRKYNCVCITGSSKFSVGEMALFTSSTSLVTPIRLVEFYYDNN